MNPLISVVVPVYNVERYLEKCVNSLLDQSYSFLEIILVDDGSTDNSGHICDRYAENHDDVRVFHKENGGLSSARNYGTEKAKGEWITYVDSDDYVEKDYVFDLWGLISSFNADMAITKTFRESERGRVTNVKRENQFESYVTDKKDAFLSVYYKSIVGWSGYGKLIRRDVIIDNPFVDGYYEDCATTYKHIEACNRIAIGDFRFNYHYVMHEGTILTGRFSEKNYRTFGVMKEIGEYIDNTYPEMDYIKVCIYMTLVNQVLILAKIDNKNYRIFFNKARPFFRKRFFKVIRSDKYSHVEKIYTIALSSWTPIMKMTVWAMKKLKAVADHR